MHPADSPRCEEAIDASGAAIRPCGGEYDPISVMVARSGEGSDSFVTERFFFLWYSHVETRVEKKWHHKTALKQVVFSIFRFFPRRSPCVARLDSTSFPILLFLVRGLSYVEIVLSIHLTYQMQRSEHPQLHRVQKNATDAHAFLPQKILPRTIAHRKMLLYVMIHEIPSTNHEICLHATILRRVCTLPFAVVPRMHQQYPTSLTAFACKNQRQRTNVHRVMARRVLTSKLAIATSYFAGP